MKALVETVEDKMRNRFLRSGCSVWTVVMLFGCHRAIPLTPEGIPMAEIRGYSTPCQGKVRVVSADGEKNSRLYVPPGEHHLSIEADSEPGLYGDDFAGDPSYACGYRSQHKVSFTTKSGMSYRMRLTQNSPPHFAIEVYEAQTPRALRAEPIAVTSVQTNVVKQCGFYGLIPGCGGPLLD